MAYLYIGIPYENEQINIYDMNKSYKHDVDQKQTQKHAYINMVSFIKSSKMDKTNLVLEVWKDTLVTFMYWWVGSLRGGF